MYGHSVTWDEKNCGDYILARVNGDADATAVSDLRRPLWDIPPDTPVVVDLAGVKLLSLHGCRTLLAAHLRRRTQGAWVALWRPQPAVRRALSATRIDQVAPVIDGSLDDWLRRSGASAAQST